ncbi:MAG: alpha-amylase [Bacteroidetes bacterium HGW-Bacteroidetes-4]|jgi:glycosidase|nr:MAG: alpha-amylase [Bacteroidetes bacterium HGW-Bacteroidetes-4]
MKQLLLFFLLATALGLNAQTLSTDPAFPTADAAVKVIFNATGTGLEAYTGDVYAHTGVTIEGSGQWKHVIGTWGTNTTQPKLTRLGTDLYELEITPSINEFYGVASGEKVTELCLVFRNAAGNAQTTDLFTEVYEVTLSVSLLTPETSLLVPMGASFEIKAAANLADSIILYHDNEVVARTNQAELTNNWTVTAEGKHWIKVEAKDESSSVFDSAYYYVRQEPVLAELPQGVKKGINYIDDETVTLVLHAPQKEYVYLIGDFNDWDVAKTLETTFSEPTTLQVTATTWMMNKTPDGTHFWFTINNLEAGAEYAYQYWIDGEIVVADPYTEKILDPWNDKYIPSTTYPDLKPYPADKTTQAVSVFQTAQEAYQWEVENFTPPAVTDMVVYEMLIRDFVATHSYKTIADTLDYLQRLGVNVLELMPVNEFEGNSSWGYNPSFYFAPDKYYGPKNDLKKLIDECHKRGIAVVIDLVLNHSYGQSPLVRMYFENGKPAANNPWYNVDHNFQNPDAHWGYDFNHESPHTKAFVDSVNTFWLTHYKVDGFRFDFTKGFSNTIYGPSDWGSAYDAARIANLKRMTDKLKEVNPNAYVIFEHLSDNTEEKELANYGILLWGNLNYSYNEAAMGWNESGKSDFSWISYKKRGWNNPHVVGYMESHDEERLMYKNMQYGNASGDYSTKELYTALNRMELAANFFLTIPGPKMIWQFGELGYDISIDQGGRLGEKPILWSYQQVNSRDRLYDVYSQLAKLKTTEPAFKTTDYVLSVSGAKKKIHLNHDDMDVVVLGNFGVVPETIVPDFQQTGTWYEFYTGEELNVTDTQAELALAPGEYRLYTTKKFDIPDINPSVSDNTAGAVLKDQLKLYPNPVDNELYVYGLNNFKQLTVYNLIGQVVYHSTTTSAVQFIDVSDFDKGIYVISAADASGKRHSGRFIKQ